MFFACCFRAVRPEFGRRPPRHRRVLADAGGPAEAVSSMPTRGDARQRGRPPFTPSRQRVHRVRVSARRRGGDTDEYLGPSRTPSTRRGRTKATSSLAPVTAPGAGRAARPRGGRRRPAAAAAATGRGPSAAAPVGGAPAAPAAPRRRGRGAASPGGSGPRRARSPCGGAPVLCLSFTVRRSTSSRCGDCFLSSASAAPAVLDGRRRRRAGVRRTSGSHASRGRRPPLQGAARADTTRVLYARLRLSLSYGLAHGTSTLAPADVTFA